MSDSSSRVVSILPRQLKERLEAAAERDGLLPSEWVRELIRTELDKRKARDG